MLQDETMAFPRTGSSSRRTLFIAVLLAGGAALALSAGGCARSGGPIELEDEADFNATVQRSPKPVLVMFYKAGCASCMALDPTIDRLAHEYAGRVVVAKFMILTFAFGVTAPDLKEKYGIIFVPHVILFVNGQERQHWIMDYNISDYREALEAAIGNANRPKPG